MNQDELIAKHIRDTGVKPGDARVRETGVPVWIIAECDYAWQGDTDRIALEYQLSHEAIDAARAYYLKHKRKVDARGFTASGYFPDELSPVSRQCDEC